jgi:hypothetical protein
MLRYLIAAAVTALALSSAPAARADDWDDYRDRLRDLRERQRERYEDLREAERDRLEDLREAQEDYFDRLRRFDRRYGGFPGYYGPGYFPAARPGYYYPPQVWYGPRYDAYRPGGFSFRGPRGNGFRIRW